MSLEDWIEETWLQDPVEGVPQQGTSFSEVRIEPCEFEELLERAMKILNARAQDSSSSRF